jgi:hypothetical protein
MTLKRKKMDKNYPSKLVLPNVPRIGFDIHLCPFPGSLFACLEYIKDPCDYDTLMAVTGACFRRLWNRDDGGNVDLSYFGDAPFQRVFAFLGYEWNSHPSGREAMLAGIRESLSRGIPAISFGILGPPEAGLVTGYDRDGDVLFGWSYFQEQNQHYYEKSDWFESMEANWRGLIVLGDHSRTRQSIQEVLKNTLEWAIDLAKIPQRPEIPDHICGLAAYDAWAEALEVDVDYPQDNDYPADNQPMMEMRAMVYGDQSTMLWERHEAVSFLRKAALTSPAAAEALNASAALYDQTADTLSVIWPWGYSSNNEAIPGLSDRKTRRELAAAVRHARALEERAVAELEKAVI